MKSYVLKALGETIQGFTVDGVIGYHAGEPVYTVTCSACGVSGVSVKHDEFRRGSARCSSNSHFAVTRGKLPQLSLPTDPEPETTVDQYVLGLRAARDAERKKYIAVARDQWNEYIWFGIDRGWKVEKMIDAHDWLNVPLEYREQILEKQKSGFYEAQKTNA